MPACLDPLSFFPFNLSACGAVCSYLSSSCCACLTSFQLNCALMQWIYSSLEKVRVFPTHFSAASWSQPLVAIRGSASVHSSIQLRRLQWTVMNWRPPWIRRCHSDASARGAEFEYRWIFQWLLLLVLIHLLVSPSHPSWFASTLALLSFSHSKSVTAAHEYTQNIYSTHKQCCGCEWAGPRSGGRAHSSSSALTRQFT